MGVKKEQTFTVNGNLENICHILRDARFYYDLKMKLESEMAGPTNAVYQFKHGMTLTSYGERVTITLMAINPGTTSVTIRSECVVPTQIIDYGKNNSNITKIIAYINNNAMVYGVPQGYTPSPQNPYAAPSQEISAASVSTANFCSNCGVQLNPGAVFCHSCGVKVN